MALVEATQTVDTEEMGVGEVMVNTAEGEMAATEEMAEMAVEEGGVEEMVIKAEEEMAEMGKILDVFVFGKQIN